MDTKWLAGRLEEIRDDINGLTDELNKEQDEEKLAVRNALFAVNNELVKAFWEIMIYRESKGLPVPSPGGG